VRLRSGVRGGFRVGRLRPGSATPPCQVSQSFDPSGVSLTRENPSPLDRSQVYSSGDEAGSERGRFAARGFYHSWKFRDPPGLPDVETGPDSR